MSNITVYYCKKCGWWRQWEEVITCVNECPNCLDKHHLYYVKGTEDEVDDFFKRQDAEEKEQKEKLENTVTVHQVIKLWPKREVIHEC